MSHKSVGYFYYRYTYECPWKDNNGNTGIDETYHTALYSVHRQDHKAQSDWYKNTLLPAAENDIQKNFYGDANRNQQGRSYTQFNKMYIKEQEFIWTDKPPVHTSGPLKGNIFGKEI